VHTINYQKDYTGSLTNEQVMDLRVVRNQKMSIHATVSDTSGGTITTYYVFVDPIRQTETEVQYDQHTMTVDDLYVFVYDYKVPFLRVKYSSGGTSGTLRVTGTTAE